MHAQCGVRGQFRRGVGASWVRVCSAEGNILCLFCTCGVATSYFGFMAVKLSDIVNPFSDAKKEDFCEWLERLELVADLQEVEKKEAFLPLFLRGHAFAVFKQLGEETKKSYAALKGALVSAFSINRITAYEQLRKRALRDGEPVDSFVADLRRLFLLTGVKEVPDELLRCAFIAGLPERCRDQLQLLPGIDSMPMEDLLVKARALVPLSCSDGVTGSCQEVGLGAAGVVSHGKGAGNAGGGRKQEGSARACFVCGDSNHVSRSCPKKVRRCFRCGDPSHFIRDCPKQGNGQGGASSSAREASPENL